MTKIYSLGLLIGLIAVSCTDPNTIGLEVQPTSANIIISSANFEGITSNTESEDSLRTDETLNLILGEISKDDIFGHSNAGFYTQILLKENNINLGDNPIVDSVVLSYTYSGSYGDSIDSFTAIEVNQIDQNIDKESTYYNHSFEMPIAVVNNVVSYELSSSDDQFLRIKLPNTFGEYILGLGTDILKDNATFLPNYQGISVFASAANTMLYLDPDGSNSFMKIYYSNDESGSDTLSLDFDLKGDAARINLFNPKPLSNLAAQDVEKRYIQSMAGYKLKIAVQNTDSIKALLLGKVINKVSMSFDVKQESQNVYAAHDRLLLGRVTKEGNNITILDYAEGGYYGGTLENDKYEFNITRYFYQLLNNDDYTNYLYLTPFNLHPDGRHLNANRTILEKDITLTIHYSQL